MNGIRFCIRYTDLAIYSILSQFKVKKHFVCDAGAVTLFEVATKNIAKMQSSAIFNGGLGDTIAYFKENGDTLWGVGDGRFLYNISKTETEKTDRTYPFITIGGGNIRNLNYGKEVTIVKDMDAVKRDFENERKNNRAEQANFHEYKKTKSRFKKYKYIDTDTGYLLPFRLYRSKKTKQEELPLVIIGMGSDTLGRDNKAPLRVARFLSVIRKLMKRSCIIAIPQSPRISNQGDIQSYKALNGFVKLLSAQDFVNEKRVYYVGVSWLGYCLQPPGNDNCRDTFNGRISDCGKRRGY